MSSSAIRAGSAYVELFLRDGKLVRGLVSAQKRLVSFGAGVQAIGRKLLGFGAAATAPFLASLAIFNRVGSGLVDLSARTGISVEALSKLSYAAGQSGADMGTLETGIKKMQVTLAAAASGSKAAQKALADVGLTVEDLAGLSPDKQFKLLADKIGKLEDPAQRAAAAVALFGRSGTQLLPMMTGLSAAIKRAEELGLVLSTKDATAADTFGDRLADLKAIVTATALKIGAALAPALTDLVDRITSAWSAVGTFLDANRQLIVLAAQVAVGISAAGAAFIVAGAVITGLGVTLGAVATAFTAIGTVLAALTSPFLLLAGLVLYLAVSFVRSTRLGQEAFAELAAGFTDLKETALAAFGGIKDALAAGDIGLAANILWLTLKLEWQKGVHALEEIWVGFKVMFFDILDQITAGIKSVWVATRSFLASGVIRLGVATGAIQGDADQIINTLQEDAARELKGFDAGQGASKEERDAAFAKQLGGSDKELADAQKAWRDALDLAAEERKAAEQKAVDTVKPAAANRALAPALALSGSSQGTFSAGAAGLLGRAGNAADRTATAAEKIADNTDEANDLLRDNQNTFG